MSTAELAASYAALALADDGVEITVRVSQLLRLATSKHKEDFNLEDRHERATGLKTHGGRKQDSMD